MNNITHAFDELVPKLEGLRTRIVYDFQVARDVLFFHHVLPYFSSKRMFFVVYSDIACRKLKKKYEVLSRLHPDIAKILEKAYIIKIGQHYKPVFGELFDLIHEDGSFKWLDALADDLRKLNDEDVVVLSGFSLFIAINGPKALNNGIRLIDSLPENITLFGFYQDGLYDDRTNRLTEKFYDIIIRVKKEDEFMGIGETTFLVGVEQSAIGDVEPGFIRFKIENGKLVEV